MYNAMLIQVIDTADFDAIFSEVIVLQKDYDKLEEICQAMLAEAQADVEDEWRSAIAVRRFEHAVYQGDDQ